MLFISYSEVKDIVVEVEGGFDVEILRLPLKKGISIMRMRREFVVITNRCVLNFGDELLIFSGKECLLVKARVSFPPSSAAAAQLPYSYTLPVYRGVAIYY